MPKGRQINAEPGSTLRSTLDTATEPVRAAAWVIEERILWGAADRLRPAIEVARWPFERLSWFLQQRLLWPLQDRLAGYERAVGAGALAALAAGIVAIGVIAFPGGGEDPQRLTTSGGATLAAETDLPPAQAGEPGPVLQGAPPSLASPGNSSPADASSASAPAEQGAVASSTSLLGEEEGATSSAGRPVAAGPAAMRVARRFSEAFVRYEVGEETERTEQVFDETTTPRLATALDERPPRQPATVEIPRAKVLNLVPGPRRGRTYTVSASLLRVGLTSELRLEMRKKNGNWLITDVRG